MIKRVDEGVVATMSNVGVVPEKDITFFNIKGKCLPMSVPGEMTFPSQEEAIAHFESKGFSLSQNDQI